MKVPVGATKLILVLSILYLFYEVYPGLTELILVLQTSPMLTYTYTYTGVPVGTNGVYPCLMDLQLVLQSIFRYFGSYTGFTELILVLRNLYGSYRSYSCAKVPVGTMSRNRSGSYHLQGQIRFLQIRTLVFRRYRSHIHYTEVTVVTTGLLSQNLYLFY